ncbi:hypothetical protein [Stenotrophomonas sp. MMGLT7]|uniref:hypothetical protein n=1 Tax=Stenotrophomonas sp. MMGLT7 TaxID=2901227 RepID=UPI001E4BCF0E|nr:hypothetical protein [Stenotrophomonas sp. MMGLT7]MCD7097183.1 hypothetical protein [Stenotrophomonas sp. MMGLT7]
MSQAPDAQAAFAAKVQELAQDIADPRRATTLKAMAATPAGREELQHRLAEFRRWNADAALVARSSAKVIAAFEKALRGRRWGIRA